MTDEDEMNIKETLRHQVVMIDNIIERMNDLEKLVGNLEWKIKVMSGSI